VRVIVDDLQGTPLTQDVQALSSGLLKRVVAKRDRFDRGLRNIVREGMRDAQFVEFRLEQLHIVIGQFLGPPLIVVFRK